jgi:REP element-mobilizing transposase RayT
MGKGPWRNWYHVTVHAYGSWLRGDPRGWRARHHREHCEGDYKHPPPKGKFDHLYELSKELMKRDPVRIASALKQLLANLFAERLLQDGIEVLIISCDGIHVHLLARFPDHEVRHWVGLAKKHASLSLRQAGLRDTEGGLWSKKCGVKPVKDRDHQVSVFHYIDDHQLEGGKIWRFNRTPASGG